MSAYAIILCIEEVDTHPNSLRYTFIVDIDDRDGLFDLGQDQVHVCIVGLDANAAYQHGTLPALESLLLLT